MLYLLQVSSWTNWLCCSFSWCCWWYWRSCTWYNFYTVDIGTNFAFLAFNFFNMRWHFVSIITNWCVFETTFQTQVAIDNRTTATVCWFRWRIRCYQRNRNVGTGKLADVVVEVVVCIDVDVVDKLVVLIKMHSGVTFILPFLHFKLPMLTLNS